MFSQFFKQIHFFVASGWSEVEPYVLAEGRGDVPPHRETNPKGPEAKRAARCKVGHALLRWVGSHRGLCPHNGWKGIGTCTKERRLNRRKKLNDVFDALMVMIGDLILK